MESEFDRLFVAAQGLLRRGEVAAAQAAIAELSRLDASDIRSTALSGAVHLRRGQPSQALACFDQVLQVRPDHAPAHNDRGLALNQLGRTAEALESFERAATLAPEMAVAHSNRAQALNALGRHEAALAGAETALALNADLANAWRHRGQAQFALEQFEAALGSHGAALLRGASRSDVLPDMAMTLAALGRCDEAMALYDEVCASRPDDPMPRYRRAFVRLVTGDFAGGWADYEARWAETFKAGHDTGAVTADLRHRLTLHPSAKDLAGKRVLVLDEQGIGDKIMFASVLPDLAASAADVTCIVERRLLSLCAHALPRIAFRAGRGPGVVDPDHFDVIVAMGSLPGAFRRSVEAFPGRPYLAPRPAITEAWRQRLGPPSTRLRIGVSWRGGVATTRTLARSMDLARLSPILDRPDCEIVNLQYGDVADEVASANAGRARPILSFPADQTRDFEQLAGLVGALDAVVTVQTTLAHLAGSLGQTAMVMIPQSPEWRYGTAGPAMPWYASLRLFRQREAGDWAPVIGEIGRALDTFSPATPT